SPLRASEIHNRRASSAWSGVGAAPWRGNCSRSPKSCACRRARRASGTRLSLCATHQPERRPMSDPIIRPARADEYDEIGRVWMESWVSTGLGEASDFLLANLRARIRKEIADGWSLYVADDNGSIAAMLALHLPKRYLDMLFVAPG